MKTQHNYQHPDKLVRDHSSLVKQIVHYLMPRLPKHVLYDDLVQAGMLGLLEAGKNYQANRGAKFTTYASIRIRGAILDEVRKHNWMPRSFYQNTRRINQAIKQLENKNNAHITDQTIADELEINLDEYRKMHQHAGYSRFSSTEEVNITHLGLAAKQTEPYSCAETADWAQLIQHAMHRLPNQEQLVITFYYAKELKLKEIGQRLGITESRACQLRQHALQTIQARITMN